jgi:hypothetical protein
MGLAPLGEGMTGGTSGGVTRRAQPASVRRPDIQRLMRPDAAWLRLCPDILKGAYHERLQG